MMKSAFAFTSAANDVCLAAKELAFGVREQVTFAKNSCAILFAEVAFELDGLVAELEQELDIPIIGCTSTAQISHLGYHRLAATLLVLTSDDCNFGMSICSIEDVNSKDLLEKAYAEAKFGLKAEEPELVFVLGAPNTRLLDDDFIGVLSRLSGNKPVFGGVSSDYSTYDRSKVFVGKDVRQGSAVILLISGNIRPKFIVGNIGPSAIAKSRVTAAKGNEIFTIDHMNMYDYFLKNEIDADDQFTLHFSPLSVEFNSLEDYDGQPVFRSVFRMNKESGSATFNTNIPEGSAVSVKMVTARDIEDTTQDALEHMRSEYLLADANGYKYSTILGISCMARHIILAFDYEIEGTLARQVLPDALNFMAFYSYGEFCPTSISNGRAVNRAHNISIALCMF